MHPSMLYSGQFEAQRNPLDHTGPTVGRVVLHPQVIAGTAMWPMVTSDDWCGMYQDPGLPLDLAFREVLDAG